MTRDDFLLLWERLAEPVLVADAQQVICAANTSLESLVRHSRSDLVGKRVDLLLPEASRGGHHAVAHQFIRSGEQQRKLAHPRLIRAHRSDGVDVPVEVSISSVEVDGARYFVLLFRDLSEQLALQDEVAALTQRLARIERMEALSTLSAGLAREFTDVLARLKGHAERAAGTLTVDPATAAGEVAGLLAQLERDTAEVGQLKLFARRDSTTGLADPRGALERATQAAQALAGPEVTLALQCDPHLPLVAVVERELEQAVLNLVHNGLHSMKDRRGRLGVLAHRLELEAPMPCTTLTLTPGTWLAISVEDEGVGIEHAVLPRIFDPFFTTKPRTEGTGLGLAMVYGFVRSANGAVNVESRVGHGTRVTLFLPVGTQGASAGEPRVVPGRKRKVLLVDADRFAATALRRSLELLGHGCHVVSHAADALSIIRLDPGAFDLVVAELSLPGMRGDELASRISLIRPGLPVAVIIGSERVPPPEGYRVLRRPATAMDIDVVLRTVAPTTPLPWKGD
jgi:PAS domain S-box-containing protein